MRPSLTPPAARLLETLSARHTEELGRLAKVVGPLLAGLDGSAREPPRSPA